VILMCVVAMQLKVHHLPCLSGVRSLKKMNFIHHPVVMVLAYFCMLSLSFVQCKKSIHGHELDNSPLLNVVS